jgi:hypothetical protein
MCIYHQKTKEWLEQEAGVDEGQKSYLNFEGSNLAKSLSDMSKGNIPEGIMQMELERAFWIGWVMARGRTPEK